MFLFGDLRGRTAWFLKAGWRELVEETERVRAAYPDDPGWSEFFAERSATIAEGRKIADITEAEATDLKRTPLADPESDDCREQGGR